MNRLKIHVITFTFLRYANFSKLMRTIHTFMASPFQCEYWPCFIFERCNKLNNETYQSWRYAWWVLIWKNQHDVKTVNVVKRAYTRNVCFCCFFLFFLHLKLFDIFFSEYHPISYLCLLLRLFACVCLFVFFLQANPF